MSQLLVSPGATDLAFVDELVSISMLETTVVVRPTRRPDALGTQVFTDVVNAATEAGLTAVLHRPGACVDSNVALDIGAANDVGSGEPVMAESGGVGLLIIRSDSSVWTIDVGSQRFVRSDQPVDRLLLADSDWTAFETMWIAPRFVRALAVNGSYLTGRRTVREPSEEHVRNDRSTPLTLSEIA